MGYNQYKLINEVFCILLFLQNFVFKILCGDFPGSTVVKNPPANVGHMGSSPGLGRSHMPWSN